MASQVSVSSTLSNNITNPKRVASRRSWGAIPFLPSRRNWYWRFPGRLVLTSTRQAFPCCTGHPRAQPTKSHDNQPFELVEDSRLANQAFSCFRISSSVDPRLLIHSDSLWLDSSRSKEGNIKSICSWVRFGSSLLRSLRPTPPKNEGFAPRASAAIPLSPRYCHAIASPIAPMNPVLLCRECRMSFGFSKMAK